ncbi:unnamed protein product [Adineta ricciae]|uniref:Uncharacterized protein n=1 Tax=Adineta ricciae TaxID=249248 RepID=A0A815RKB5_ADIRI|nr:unnamed protein product [Adineta ricciae]CAF1477018.1 unnamed protein product [Adineta ricciae]
MLIRFFNLNHRFQSLLNSSFTRLKVDDNRHQIISIHSFNENTPEIISTIQSHLSSFQSLQSLILYSIKSDHLSSLIQELTYLPNFFSLTIDLWIEKQNHVDIYQSIFNLSKLKYLKYRTMDTNDVDIDIFLTRGN